MRRAPSRAFSISVACGTRRPDGAVSAGAVERVFLLATLQMYKKEAPSWGGEGQKQRSSVLLRLAGRVSGLFTRGLCIRGLLLLRLLNLLLLLLFLLLLLLLPTAANQQVHACCQKG